MTTATALSPKRMWSAVGSMALCVSMLIASEFMPVSLLTPIARDLRATEGMAGQAIAVSGLFAVVTSLLIATIAGRFDRRNVLLTLTALMTASLVLIAVAGSFPLLMVARAILGVVIGGFWALSTATVMRLVPADAVPKALGLLYTGNAVATAFAAPIGSYFGGIVGWRGVFWALVPLGLATLVWQWVSLPSIKPQAAIPVGELFRLLKRRYVAFATFAVMLTFAGAFTAFTYFRPFLEGTVRVTLPQLSALLLALGMAGFVGTYIAGRLAGSHLRPLLRWLPIGVAVATLAMLLGGRSLPAVAVAMFAWGTLNSAVPVAWGIWQTKGFADRPESGGGLMVAAIQLAIMLGAGLGGVLLDNLSIVATFVGAVVLLVLASFVVGNGERILSADATGAGS
ncbi:MFS transporter [bacterium]|nr:MAG: MFS transporter [bacterium]